MHLLIKINKQINEFFYIYFMHNIVLYILLQYILIYFF